MWRFPWGYKESIAIVLGVMGIGILLQLILGNFNFFFLAYPVNIVCGGVLVFLLLGLLLIRKSTFYKWLSGAPLAVILIGVMLVLTLIMGLTDRKSVV